MTVYLCSIYGARGDPTKNVSVTNWPAAYPIKYDAYNVSKWYNPPDFMVEIVRDLVISGVTAGYKEVMLYLWANVSLYIEVEFRIGGYPVTVDSFYLIGGTTFWKIYKVIGERIMVWTGWLNTQKHEIRAGIYGLPNDIL